MSDDDRPRRRTGLGSMILCTLLGSGLLAFTLKGQDWWQWQGIWPSILTNAGTTLLLAAVLFILERRFTGRVIRANRLAVREAAAEVEESLQHRTDELSARIDELQAQVEQRMHARAESQDAAVAGLDTPTYESVSTVLTEANRLNALSYGQIVVQATPDPDGIWFTFSFGTHPDTGPNGFRPPGLALEVKAVLPHNAPKKGLGTPIIEEVWQPVDQLADVAARMNVQLQKAGYWTGSETVDWTLTMLNFKRSLDLAIASRRGDRAPWQLHGPLIQLVGADWAVTEAGIEGRHANEVVLDESNFPPWRGLGPRRNSKATEWDPELPDGADPTEWRTLIRLGRGQFPRGALNIYPSMPSWAPFTGEDATDH